MAEFVIINENLSNRFRYIAWCDFRLTNRCTCPTGTVIGEKHENERAAAPYLYGQKGEAIVSFLEPPREYMTKRCWKARNNNSIPQIHYMDIRGTVHTLIQ
jgi:hypothetical protein